MNRKKIKCRIAEILSILLVMTSTMGSITLASEEVSGANELEEASLEYIYQDDEKVIKAVVSEDMKLPKGSTLQVRELKDYEADDAQNEKFVQMKEWIDGKVANEKRKINEAFYYELYFSSDGEPLSPADGSMEVTFTYQTQKQPKEKGQSLDEHPSVSLYKAGADGVEELNDPDMSLSPSGGVTEFTYIEDSFMPIALVFSEPQAAPSQEELVDESSNVREEEQAVSPLTTIDTVDSSEKGIEIRMFNYKNSTPANTWGPYTQNGKKGMLKQGLLEPTLNKNGLPVAKNKNIGVLKGSFEGGTKANHLFSKEIYDETGYFYYSSFDNYAYYNQDSKNFTVYDQIGTPSDDNVYFFNRGNFMPYNKIEAGRLSKNKNYYDQYGNQRSEDDPRYGEALYRTKGEDFYFGMTVDASFVQPKSGMHNGQEMVYEFSGDDDMWVFVDGVLVLDLGGIHDAHTGSINFATGKVEWTDGERESSLGTKSTTIRNQFKVAGKENQTKWKENTFSNYSQHEIKIFYMERGAGASNCKMKFNLPVVPKGSVNISKEVTNINEGSYSDVDFIFRLFVEKENQNQADESDIVANGKRYSLLRNQVYQKKQGTSTTVQQTGADGNFRLKHGQTAQFLEIAEMDREYIVQEVDVVQDYYDEFEVNGTPVDEAGGKIENTADGTMIVQTAPLKVGENLIVTMQNQCNSNNHHDLIIKKRMAEGQRSGEEYYMQVFIGGKPYSGVYTRESENSEPVDATSSDNGILSIKAGETARITQIAAATSFEVSEVNLNLQKFESPVYEALKDSAENIVIGDGIKGTIKYKSNATLIVTNKQKFGALKIIKHIDDSKISYGDPVFTFRIKGPEGLVLYRTLRFAKEDNKEERTTVLNLPFGEYEVEELDTIRYQLKSENPQKKQVNSSDTMTVYEFTNQLSYQKNFSHSDVLENAFTISEDGSVTCSQNRIPGKPSE